MPTKFERLQSLLAELFQLDQADLDFGIYRIMNLRRGEITRFLSQELLPQVRTALAGQGAAGHAEIQAELRQAEQQAQALGVDANAVPKVQQLRERLAAYGADPAALEDEVYSHLYDFFRRYYDEGDFISARRYKEGVYAIPYEGEEVKLHWANADQYYVKTAENFRDYAFRLNSGRRVHFKLAEAEADRDNVKAAEGKDRRFLFAGVAAQRSGGGEGRFFAGDSPVGELSRQPAQNDSGGDELVIRFEYRADPEKRKQAELNVLAAAMILADAPADWKAELAAARPTEANPRRMLLDKQLADYTARNTFDYFIHKDLRGFLRRELDFYIKNEVVRLDDIEDETLPRVEATLGKVRGLRQVAHKIIDFLAQIEELQKRLWLKKKFVVETNYCVTLDRVPEALYAEIAANGAQRAEWVRLFAIDEIAESTVTPGYAEPLTVGFLKANLFLVLDTKFFDAAFRDRLVASFEDLDGQIDGLLIHSENFQALRFLNARYREQVKCIYIDPPYNTGSDGFPYKDEYQHSSWLSMMDDRVSKAFALLSPDGTMLSSLDDNEVSSFNSFMAARVGQENHVGTLVWKGATDNNPSRIAVEHEYIVCYAKSRDDAEGQWSTSENEIKQLMLDAFEKLAARATSQHELESQFERFATEHREELGDLYRYRRIDEHGPFAARRNMENPGKPGYTYDIMHPGTDKPCARPYWGWRFPESTMKRLLAENRIIFGETEAKIPELKVYLREVRFPLRSVFSMDARKGSNDLDRLFGSRDVFKNPKPVELLEHVLPFVSLRDSLVLDFFAGSATTGHAVINMNRRNSCTRKYILVEMGDHFDSILKPRIQKVIYSRDWKDGKPVSRAGSSHLFKYMRLESYEDTLNNLAFRPREGAQLALAGSDAFREGYTLHYILDAESRDSLLNVRVFEDPFGYTLDVATGTVGETRPIAVDLVETFNYLLGLRVRHVDAIQGYRVVQGRNPQGERVLVIWRSLKEKSNADLETFFRKQDYNPRDMEFDLIYVNGDNHLENLRRPNETWKVRLIEEEFMRLMFDVQDA